MTHLDRDKLRSIKERPMLRRCAASQDREAGLILLAHREAWFQDRLCGGFRGHLLFARASRSRTKLRAEGRPGEKWLRSQRLERPASLCPKDIRHRARPPLDHRDSAATEHA